MTARTTADPWVGTTVHRRYLVSEQVSREGDVATYAATDQHMLRPVRLRIYEAPADHTRQLSLAAALHRAAHGNLESVLAYGETPAGAYVVTEQVEGHLLSDDLQPGVAVRPNRAFAFLEPVVDALAAAHEGGLAHGALDTSQVLLTGDGRVEVTGFTVADAGADQTRGDVLACGAMLHLLLTGTPHAPDAPAPSALVPRLPAYADALVELMTAPDPARPSSARTLVPLVREVAEALLEDRPEDPALVDRIRDARTGAEPTSPPAPTDDADAEPEPAAPPVQVPAQARREAQDTAVPAPAVPAAPRRTAGRLLLVAVTALALWGAWVLLAPGETAETAGSVDPPNVVGMPVSEARGALQDAGLRVAVGEGEYSDTVARGEVIEALLPAAGEVDGLVTLVPSLGPQRPKVPDLTGLKVAVAQRKLVSRGLTIGPIVEILGSDVPAGRVAGTLPTVGSRVPAGAQVGLRVSAGQGSFAMPSFLGWTFEQARYGARRFSLTVVAKGSPAADSVVVSQTPEPGTMITGDTRVTLATRN